MQGGTQIQLPYLSKANKIIIGLSVGFFLLQSILQQTAGFHLENFLGLSAGMVLKGHIYQLFTYPLVSRGLMEVIFIALLIWFIGSDLENLWGTKKYLSLIAVSSIGGGIIYFILTATLFATDLLFIPLMGLHGISGAMLVAYAIIYPDRQFLFMFIIPVKAKYFCGILIFILLYTGIFSRMGALSWGHLGSMFIGFLYMKGSDSIRLFWKRDPKIKGLSKKKEQSHLKLVKDDSEGKPPKYWH